MERRISGQAFEYFLDQYAQYKVKRSLVRDESLWRTGKSGLGEASEMMCPHPLMACKQRDIALPPADEVSLHSDVKRERNKVIFLNGHLFLMRTMTECNKCIVKYVCIKHTLSSIKHTMM